MNKNKIVIALDGPAASGKSSTAKEVAKKLNIIYLDTGAMYRVVTLFALENNIAVTDLVNLGKIVDEINFSITGDVSNPTFIVNGRDVTKDIRSREVTNNVSDYCAVGIVREKLVEMQQRYSENDSCILDGRDIGTVVFPNADYKFYFVADLIERAKRRLKELEDKGVKSDLDTVIKDIERRDNKDSSRANSPLTKAYDAIEVDTTFMEFEDQVDLIVSKVLNG